jgi:hypothetical protein
MKIIIYSLLFIIININTIGQEKKKVEALYISSPLVIDGVLDEPVYKQTTPAKDFVQLQPFNGKPSFQPSEVYFFYDQTAVYVGGMLYDSAPDSIFSFLTERDEIWNADYFGVYIDPYNQGQLAFGFFINAAGVQGDLKATKNDGDNEDSNWNAVWESKTRITDKGWIFEMRIPYSALRFPKTNVNVWGLNMFRNIKRYNSNNSWNFIDRNISGFIHQEGQLTGIKDITPPVRLSFSPYVSTYVETKKESRPQYLYKGGMDLKYGLSESFTLDMMLIPDFGQIQSDDKRLNLSPYELYYDEKRQFFTEGTELFQRANIFYSRRIGAAPKFSASDAKNTTEIVDKNPSETQLINATKISGRTSGGLGIGVLNAMTLPSFATLRDTITGNTRLTRVQPFTNYNVSVVDQSLKNSSYISLINSNMSMADSRFRANVTATQFQIRNKAKSIAITGKGGISARGERNYETGFYGYLSIDKNKGKLHFGVSQNIYSDKYNPNDLGYLQQNNQMLTESYVYYQVIKPFWVIREFNGNIWWDYIRMYKPNTLFENQMGYNANVLFKNNYSININGGLGGNKYDYYEPRIKGWYYYSPHYYWGNFNFSSDSRKHLSFYLYYGVNKHPTTDQVRHSGEVSMNIRVGHHFQMNYDISFSNSNNDRGYVDNNKNEDSIYFTRRDVKILENIFSVSYAINNKATLKLRARHYWSGAKNKQFFLLQNDGLLNSNFSYTHNDENFNAFTIDMIFRWIFAPGSEMTIAWKNSAYADQHDVVNNYFNNLKNTWTNQTNSLSLKVLYYIDFNSLKRNKG